MRRNCAALGVPRPFVRGGSALFLSILKRGQINNCPIFRRGQYTKTFALLTTGEHVFVFIASILDSNIFYSNIHLFLLHRWRLQPSQARRGPCSAMPKAPRYKYHMGNHRRNRSPRPQPRKFSKVASLIEIN